MQREIVREPDFDEQAERLLGDMEQADKFTTAAEWILARDPRQGTPVTDDESVWSMPMCPVDGRQVTLYYEFDDKTVTFIAIIAE